MGTQTTRRARLACSLAVAAAVCLAFCSTSFAAEAVVEDGTVRVTAGANQVSYAPEKGTVAIRGEGVDLERPGTAFLLSHGDGGATLVSLKDAAKAAGQFDLGKAEALVAAVTLHEKPQRLAVCLLELLGRQQTISVPLGQLGLAQEAVFAGYDLTTDTFQGPLTGALSRSLSGNGLALVALAQAGVEPFLLSTSHSASGAEPDLGEVQWDAQRKVLSGASSVVGDEKYELRLFAPPEPIRLVAEAASVSPPDKEAGITTDLMQTRQWLRVFLRSPKAQQVKWQVTFAEKPARKAEEVAVKLSATALSARRVQLRCASGGEEVLLRRSDGAVLAVTSPWIDDTTAAPDTEYTYTAHPLSWAGNQAVLATATVKTPSLPPLPPLPDISLSDLQPEKAVNGWNGDPRRNLSIEDNPLSIRGEVFQKGMGVHAVSELVYVLKPHYKRFVAVVGVDDEKNDSPAGSVTFEVYADDKELFKSAVLTPFDERLGINVEIPVGAKQLRLVVGDGGNGVGCDHADWANCGFLTLGAKPEEPVAEVPAGFVPVFNGKNLDGWDGDPQFWSVKDGVIRGETTEQKVAKNNTFLIWRGGELKDFVLRLKFRIQNGNSGVQYRSKDLGEWRVSGYQAEVENNPGTVGFLYHEAGRGSLVNVGDFVEIDEKGEKRVVSRVSDKDALVKADFYRDKDWNEYTITARGSHLIHELNGYQTMELLDDDAAGALRAGILALQIHAGPPMVVEYKDIWVKQLTANYGKAVCLFNGENLDGWTHSSDQLKDTWSVKNGVLDNTGNPAGYVRTTADYDNYVLRVQLRHLTDGNSGVLCRMVGEDKVWPRSLECQGQRGALGDIWNIGEFPMKAAADRTDGRHTRKANLSNEKPLGEWNQYEITLDGGDLEIKVNDLVQNVATECWETPGKICLQSEGAHMQFRNVVLVPIVKGAG
jgi:hypothetical protein